MKCMWNYKQSTGELTRDGVAVGTGYSGSGAGKNNPALENEEDVGPIPRGSYAIKLQPECMSMLPLAGGGACANCEGVAAHKHGPFVLRLTPDAANEMFGRAGFLIHGDSIKAPGTASEGCIVMGPQIRRKISASGDGALTVIG